MSKLPTIDHLFVERVSDLSNLLGNVAKALGPDPFPKKSLRKKHFVNSVFFNLLNQIQRSCEELNRRIDLRDDREKLQYERQVFEEFVYEVQKLVSRFGLQGPRQTRDISNSVKNALEVAKSKGISLPKEPSRALNQAANEAIRCAGWYDLHNLKKSVRSLQEYIDGSVKHGSIAKRGISSTEVYRASAAELIDSVKYELQVQLDEKGLDFERQYNSLENLMIYNNGRELRDAIR